MRQYICQWFFAEFYSTLQQWLPSKNRDRLSFSLDIHFAPVVPRSQNLLDSNLDYLVANDGVPLMEVVSFLSNLKGELGCVSMNKYSLCFASLLISGIIFFTITFRICFCIWFNKRKFYQDIATEIIICLKKASIS